LPSPLRDAEIEKAQLTLLQSASTAEKAQLTWAAVSGEDAGDLVGAEGEGDAAVVVAPAGAVAVGVGPEEVAEEALVGDVDGALDVPDPGEAVEVRREAPVHAEDLVIDDGSDGEAVEAVGEELPEADAEAALALVVEAVDAVDGGALVVAPEQEEVVRVPDLVRQQQADGLDALLAAVHVVAQEQVVELEQAGHLEAASAWTKEWSRLWTATHTATRGLPSRPSRRPPPARELERAAGARASRRPSRCAARERQEGGGGSVRGADWEVRRCAPPQLRRR